MTAPELKRYNLTTEVSPRGAFYGDMTENASGEYVLYSDVQAYTQAAIAAAIMGAADIADNTGTCLLPSGHFLSERCGNAIRAAIPTDATAALDAMLANARDEALDEVIELAKRHAPDFVPFAERMKGKTLC